MIAQGYKNGELVCEFEKSAISLDQNGYDIDALVIDGVSHDVSPPTDPPSNLTDVEISFLKVQEKLNLDEEKRTGKKVDPEGCVPLSRAIAANAILVSGSLFPSAEDLETEFNQYLLSIIYADPESKTNESSSVEQKQKVLHFTLVMLQGQSFGLKYQSELGAYERTASREFSQKVKDDKEFAWLDLPCPKMHKTLPEFNTIRTMFLTLMK